MNAELRVILSGSLALAIVTLLPGCTSPRERVAQGSAQVIKVYGAVEAEDGHGRRLLTAGDAVNQGTTITTGRATVTLLLRRNGRLTLREDSSFRLDELQDEVTRLTVLKGGIAGHVTKMTDESLVEIVAHRGKTTVLSKEARFQVFSVGIFRCAQGRMHVHVNVDPKQVGPEFTISAGQEVDATVANPLVTQMNSAIVLYLESSLD